MISQWSLETVWRRCPVWKNLLLPLQYQGLQEDITADSTVEGLLGAFSFHAHTVIFPCCHLDHENVKTTQHSGVNSSRISRSQDMKRRSINSRCRSTRFHRAAEWRRCRFGNTDPKNTSHDERRSFAQTTHGAQEGGGCAGCRGAASRAAPRAWTPRPSTAAHSGDRSPWLAARFSGYKLLSPLAALCDRFWRLVEGFWSGFQRGICCVGLLSL